jgi:hypothetical protein
MRKSCKAAGAQAVLLVAMTPMLLLVRLALAGSTSADTPTTAN